MGRATSLFRALSYAASPRSARSVLATAIALTTAIYSAPALAAEVTGKLLLAPYRLPPKESAAGAFQWEIENGVKEVIADRVDARRELAVVLVGEGASAMPERPEAAFSGGGLLPSTIVVRPGATLLLRNDDEIAHELYATGKDGFAAEATSPRGRRSIAVKDAGMIELRDQLLPHLSGLQPRDRNVIAVASPAPVGQFLFPEIPHRQVQLKACTAKTRSRPNEVEVAEAASRSIPIALTAPSAKE